MPAKIDLTGHIYGSLTVQGFSGTRRTSGGDSKRTWECSCVCGKIVVVDGGLLRNGNTSSCGCKWLGNVTKHGLHRTPFYRSWVDMKTRCDKPNNKFYHRYGGRGITYDPRWKDFENFQRDMEENYKKGLTLDRKDPNGNYTKDNCSWVTANRQQKNKGISPRNKTGVTGVHIWVDKKQNTKYYVGGFVDLSGKINNKYFSTKKYGDELAFFMACEYRESQIMLLNLQGAGYGENHGKPDYNTKCGRCTLDD